jgi:hypothetical protein
VKYGRINLEETSKLNDDIVDSGSTARRRRGRQLSIWRDRAYDSLGYSIIRIGTTVDANLYPLSGFNATNIGVADGSFDYQRGLGR